MQGVLNQSGVVPMSHIALRRSFTFHRTVSLRSQLSHGNSNVLLGEQRLLKNIGRVPFADLILRCETSRDSSTSTRSLVEPSVSKCSAELEYNQPTENRGSVPTTANAPGRRRGKSTASRAARLKVETADHSALNAPSRGSNARGRSPSPGKGSRRVSPGGTTLPAEPEIASSDTRRESGGSASLSLAIVKYDTIAELDPQKARRSLHKLSKKTQKRLHRGTPLAVGSKRKPKRVVRKLSKKERKMIYKMERKKVLKKKRAQKQAGEQATNSDVRPPKLIPLAVTVGTGLLLWCCPTPSGISEEGWNLVAIFAATTVGFVSQPMPLGGVALVGLLVSVVTGTLPFSQAFSGFAGTTPWVTLGAFLFAKGISISGIGKRAAFFLISRFGNTVLGLSYSHLRSFARQPPVMACAAAACDGLRGSRLRWLARQPPAMACAAATCDGLRGSHLRWLARQPPAMACAAATCDRLRGSHLRWLARQPPAMACAAAACDGLRGSRLRWLARQPPASACAAAPYERELCCSRLRALCQQPPVSAMPWQSRLRALAAVTMQGLRGSRLGEPSAAAACEGLRCSRLRGLRGSRLRSLRCSRLAKLRRQPPGDIGAAAACVALYGSLAALRQLTGRPWAARQPPRSGFKARQPPAMACAAAAPAMACAVPPAMASGAGSHYEPGMGSRCDGWLLRRQPPASELGAAAAHDGLRGSRLAMVARQPPAMSQRRQPLGELRGSRPGDGYAAAACDGLRGSRRRWLARQPLRWLMRQPP
ncbi:hypothetical protein CYMTET_39136 [Cymbomonas tetramitiformis]|uniref:Uncharacterized protein n=1 Tax=Cymbomonas tetramitiformis TaxID=36881 RepID=A0AAE0F4K4_9CHLO|nr:hypothetical protein CYMTET_39136 [Cymbomonas tetramitiformis]